MTITVLQPSPDGEISHGDVREKVNELVDNANIINATLEVVSTDLITVTTSTTNPGYFTGVTEVVPSVGFTLIDPATCTFRNDTGRTISEAIGFVSVMPEKTGGVGTTDTLHICSERSVDGGTTWTLNEYSMRPIEVTNSTESFKTVQSTLLNFPDQALIRFRIYTEDGEVGLAPINHTVLGQSITTPSFTWAIAEV